MRKFQQALAVTLITSLVSSTVAASHAWAVGDYEPTPQYAPQAVQGVAGPEDGITYDDQYVTVRVPRSQYVRQVTYQDQQVLNRQYNLNVGPERQCPKYYGADRQLLVSRYEDLKQKQEANRDASPAYGAMVGGAIGGVGAVIAGAAFWPVLAVAGIGAAIGGLINWFRGGKDNNAREIAQREHRVEIENEQIEMNCIYNALHANPNSGLYANSIPGQTSAGVVMTDTRGKVQVTADTCHLLNGNCGQQIPQPDFNNVPSNSGASVTSNGSAGGNQAGYAPTYNYSSTTTTTSGDSGNAPTSFADLCR